MILSPYLRPKTDLTFGALAKNIQDQVALLPKMGVVLSLSLLFARPAKSSQLLFTNTSHLTKLIF